jgi:hypothetical protein
MGGGAGGSGPVHAASAPAAISSRTPRHERRRGSPRLYVLPQLIRKQCTELLAEFLTLDFAVIICEIRKFRFLRKFFAVPLRNPRRVSV